MRARSLLSPARLVLTALGVLVAVVAILWAVPSNRYLLLPDPAHPVAPIVTVPGEKPDRDGGGIYFVDVIQRKASLLERLFPGIHDGSTLVPASAVRAPGLSEEAQRRESLREMARSQDVAAAVALRELGYDVRVRNLGVVVVGVDPEAPAFGRVKIGDLIVEVDGDPVRTPGAIRRRIGKRTPGDPVRITLRRDGKREELRLRTIAAPEPKRRAIIGVIPEQAARIDLPVEVEINSGRIGGPSAGLAFALDLLEELGREVDRGYKVAVTGQLELDGAVLPIGGVRQKVVGAKQAGADLFLVPGENAPEARRYAEGLRIIPVNSFQQALRRLATARRSSSK